MQQPLLWVAVSFALGILAANAVSVPIIYLLLPALALALAALVWARGRLWLLCPLCFIAGAVSFTARTAIIAPDDLRTILGDEPREAAVRGTLVDTPSQRVFERDGTERWRTLARIEVDAICLNQEWGSACGEVIVTTPDILPNQFYYGQRVEIQGVIRRPRNALAPGSFDYRRYLKTLGIDYQLWVASTNDWQLLNSPGALPWFARFGPWAQSMLARGLPQDTYVQLLWAMTLGWKTGLSGEVSEPFMRSGTMHVFAISGLHIALIAAILVATLKLFRLRRPTCAWIVIPLIWAYTMATGWQASAIRSTIMSSVIIFGWCLRRPSDLFNSLMAAGFLILVWDPLQLFQAGFQLSFFVVLALALLTPALDHLRDRMLAPDPFLAPQFRTRLWRWVNGTAHYVVASFAVSLAAWLGSLPLIAYYFHLLTPVTLIANMVVVPLSSGALACNLATLTIGPLCPAAAELFNHCAWFFMILMVKVSEWAAGVRLGVFHMAMPSVMDIIVYYALLLAVFSGWLFRVHVRKWAAGAMVAVVVPLAAGEWWRNDSVMTVLPLGGGAAVYVKHDDEWLVDCGDLEGARHITNPFLQSRGVNRLPHLLLTHGDVRHVEAAPLIHQIFSGHNIYMSPLRFRSRPYRLVQEYFHTNNVLVKTVTTGQRLGMWEVLHPDEDTRFSQADDNAIVLFGKIHAQRLLLLSDLGIAGQNALLERHPDLQADIIVTGLPRESEPVADGFLEAVQPKLIIVADAEFPAPERASDRLRARLARCGIPVIYTSDSGAVSLTFSRQTFAIQTMNSSESN
jgi:competence protein ComEC